MVGDLLGKKLILNEFVAYSELAGMLSTPDNPLSGRTVVILTYALCGFANLSSIGIQIGGIGGIAPERKGDLARLGLIAVLGGTLACFQTATIAGVLITEEESRLVTTQEAPEAPPSPAANSTATPTPDASPATAATPSPTTLGEEVKEAAEELNEETEIQPLTPTPEAPET